MTDILSTRIGVLGGGQLGKMLSLAAQPWNVRLHVLDAQHDYPAGQTGVHFTEGNYKDYDDVLAFGRGMDVITIEIEHVNTRALHQLVREGKTVHPRPEALDIIKDKGLQKQFYQKHDLPTSRFALYDDEQQVRMAVQRGDWSLPLVQKARTGGFDGRGVAIIRNENDLETKLLAGPSVVEPLVDIDKEIAVIVARNEQGEVTAYPAVEMIFDPDANLVDYLVCPAELDATQQARASELARRAIAAYDVCGLLAVELFLTRDGEFHINEVAPRTHNSGHHTIDANVTSQFEQQLRAVLDLPLGDTALHSPAVMVNVLGEPDQTGEARYIGADKLLAIPGVHLHLYGKAITKPMRKMGHVTITAATKDDAVARIADVKASLKVVARGME